MTEPQAKALMAKLIAAFPRPPIEPLTAKVYVEQIERLQIYGAGLEAVNRLIAGEHYMPRVAAIVEMYHAVRPDFLPPGLPEPKVTPEQQAENLRQAKAMLERLAKSNTMEMH